MYLKDLKKKEREKNRVSFLQQPWFTAQTLNMWWYFLSFTKIALSILSDEMRFKLAWKAAGNMDLFKGF